MLLNRVALIEAEREEKEGEGNAPHMLRRDKYSVQGETYVTTKFNSAYIQGFSRAARR